MFNHSVKRKRRSSASSGGDMSSSSMISFTQEEYSADVVWGESPPLDDTDDVFRVSRDSDNNALPVLHEEEWTAPVPKRMKSRVIQQAKDDVADRSKKSIDAIKALLSPTNDLNDSLESNNESFDSDCLEKSFSSETALAVNRSNENADTKTTDKNALTSCDLGEDSEFSNIDFEMIDSLVACAKQRSVSQQSLSQNESQPELTDSSVRPLANDVTMNLLSTRSSVPAQEKVQLSDNVGLLKKDERNTSVKSAVKTAPNALFHPSYSHSLKLTGPRNGHNLQPTSEQPALVGSKSQHTSQIKNDPYRLKREQALAKRRLAKDKGRVELSQPRPQLRQNLPQQNVPCLRQQGSASVHTQRRNFPVNEKFVQCQRGFSTEGTCMHIRASPSENLLHHDRASGLGKLGSSTGALTRHGQQLNQGQALSIQEGNILHRCVPEKTVDSEDDFAAVEALMSKFEGRIADDKIPDDVKRKKLPTTIEEGNMNDYDAIEAMMKSVESQFHPSQDEKSLRLSASHGQQETYYPQSFPSKNRDIFENTSQLQNQVDRGKENPYCSNFSSSALEKGRANAYLPNKRQDSCKLKSSQCVPAKQPHPLYPTNRQSPTILSTTGEQRSNVAHANPDPRREIKRHCYRLIAVDVSTKLDDKKCPMKHVRCLNYFHSADGHDKEIRRSIDNIIVVLSEDWYESDIRGGDIIHLVTSLTAFDFDNLLAPSVAKRMEHGLQAESLEFRVDNSGGLIVIHPDILVTPTRISDSFACSRKAILSDRIRGVGATNEAAVLGNMKHQFIEKLVRIKLSQDYTSSPSPTILGNEFGIGHRGKSDDDLEHHVIDELIKDVISQHAVSLYCVGVSDEAARVTLLETVESTCRWINQKFFPEESGMQSHKGVGVKWNDVESLEETIWCPVLGIKGQVDLILNGLDERINKNVHLPIELKTGKWRPNGLIGHRAQAMLYVIMLTLRMKSDMTLPHDISVNPLPITGILLYLGNGETKYECISPQWSEVRALVLSRNKLAVSLKRMRGLSKHTAENYTGQLPPLLKSPSCKWCFSAAECMVYHRATEKFSSNSIIDSGSQESFKPRQDAAEMSGDPKLYQYLTDGITVNQMSYFKHWDTLLDLESKATEQTLHQNTNRNIWTSFLSKNKLYTLQSTSHNESKARGLSHETQNLYTWSMCHEGTDETLPCSHEFVEGDKISLSLQKEPLYGFRDANPSCEDIEDIGCSVTSWDIMNVEPHVASGTVLSVRDGILLVGFSKLSGRLRSVGKIASKDSTNRNSQWRFRLEKEELTVSLISLLRSNVLRLLTVTHNPKQFMSVNSKLLDNSTPCSKSLSNEPSEWVKRLSSLVIDLVAPRFVVHNNCVFNGLESTIDTEVQFFLPPLNPVQMLFLRNLKLKMGRFSSQGVVTRQFYESSPPPCFSGCHPLGLLAEYKDLNIGQQQAVQKVLSSMDYTLLLGMPGSGKTSTLSFIIRTLVSRGEKVLITSYTNAAVDNLMYKLSESGVSPAMMARLGQVESMVDGVKDYALVDLKPGNRRTVCDLACRIEECRVVVSTVLTAAKSDLLLKMAPFDWCVMDEAGQISQPAALGGMLLAKKYLLVGDNYQLPPLVLSLEAQLMGMEVSMFKRLSEAHPNAVASLTAQYRMNSDITSLANALIYERRLHCGNEEVANARLCYLRSTQNLELLSISNKAWLYQCLDPENCVVFINTDSLEIDSMSDMQLDGRERNYNVPRDTRRSSGTIHRNDVDTVKKVVLDNPTEVFIVTLLVEGLALCGLVNLESSVGIISPYRAQVKSIQESLRECASSRNIGTNGVGCTVNRCSNDVVVLNALNHIAENGVSTVDKYQGRDKEVIILSLVRSNDRGQVGDLLRDWRRVNVALTRAKRKLLIVGSLNMMEHVPVLRDMKRLMIEKNWVVEVPSDGLSNIEIVHL